MRTYEEAKAASLDRRAFSNGTEWDCWSSEWCQRCIHDKDEGCPLVAVALIDARTPSEWFEQPRDDRGRVSLYNRYHCVEFRDEDNPGGTEPEPSPEQPGQEALLPREPWTATRLLSQPRHEPAGAPK